MNKWCVSVFGTPPYARAHTHTHTHTHTLHVAFLDDWLGEELSDLLHFYPIDWKIAVNLCQYEIFLFTNRYNWVDIDGTENSENTPTLIRFSLTSLSGHVGGKGRGGGSVALERGWFSFASGVSLGFV